ncbi:MAG: hypothetical protein KY456_16595 [Chloroflexi bacterium]|nr:hypothetical protein [Chloroflexota bacterium]
MDEPRDPSALPSAVRTRSRVLGVTGGAAISAESYDELDKRVVGLTLPEASTVAADITLEIAWVFHDLATDLDREDGTLPEWEWQITEWRKKSTGTEGLD